MWFERQRSKLDSRVACCVFTVAVADAADPLILFCAIFQRTEDCCNAEVFQKASPQRRGRERKVKERTIRFLQGECCWQQPTAFGAMLCLAAILDGRQMTHMPTRQENTRRLNDRFAKSDFEVQSKTSEHLRVEMERCGMAVMLCMR